MLFFVVSAKYLQYLQVVPEIEVEVEVEPGFIEGKAWAQDAQALEEHLREYDNAATDEEAELIATKYNLFT